MSSLNILVYGATGSQARPTVQHLLANGHTPYVLTRHPDKAASLVNLGAKVVIGDLADPASLRAASTGMDAVALLIPAFLDNPMAAAEYGKNAIEAARAVGVKHIVWNTSGAVPPARTGNPMGDSRIEVLEALKESGLSYVVLEPTVYMENWLGPWTSIPLVTEGKVAYPILAHRKVGWIASDDVGALAAAALERPHLSGAHYKISGIETPTGDELAALFSEALGRSLVYYAMTPEEMGAAMEKILGLGAGAAVAASYRADQQNPNPAPLHYPMDEVLNDLPVHMTRIVEWVARHAPAFAPR
jgi:uncharacterized protein YbjT (DUF2867 family)